MPPRCNHWVIGDVHGCYQPLQRLLGVLPKNDHVVFCGDVINRGPDTASTMELVWSLVTDGRATWLRGNHEQNLLQRIRDPDCNSANPWLPRLRELPTVFWGHGWLATHAGFDSKGHPDLTIREPFWEHYDGSHGLVVIGHTPRPNVERHGRIVMVDTGAVYGGQLSAYCPETEAVVQVEGIQKTTAATRNRMAPLLQAVPC
ncbi:metallophosphoesterase [Synechococcus sp. CC9311]|uniref:metallophosphoesterase n=1 Tax=Synechococcus sp. (strain CC9311) TaxID=64471 RepID=UPI0000DDAD14|nr:metallophosphoesterase [Synechococcus sp. CC9311]ABI46386.1 Serine/threonine specific protein phosphatase [Synechococcus sp. CC9311]